MSKRADFGLNEVQLPKELQRVLRAGGEELADASMKCSSRRNCNPRLLPPGAPWPPSLNEVQFPKELQRRGRRGRVDAGDASMKCSSRRNCNIAAANVRPVHV